MARGGLPAAPNSNPRLQPFACSLPTECPTICLFLLMPWVLPKGGRVLKVTEAAESVSGNPSPPTNISKAYAALVFILMSFLKPSQTYLKFLDHVDEERRSVG